MEYNSTWILVFKVRLKEFMYKRRLVVYGDISLESHYRWLDLAVPGSVGHSFLIPQFPVISFKAKRLRCKIYVKVQVLQALQSVSLNWRGQSGDQPSVTGNTSKRSRHANHDFGPQRTLFSARKPEWAKYSPIGARNWAIILRISKELMLGCARYVYLNYQPGSRNIKSHNSTDSFHKPTKKRCRFHPSDRALLVPFPRRNSQD